MGKQEFIDRLRMALNGNVPQALVAENVNYYSEYIDSQIRSGRQELEVMASLGDPRLIAKTIIETNAPEDGAEEASYREAGAGSYGQGASQGRDWQGYGQGYDGNRKKAVHVPGWVWLVAVILIVVLIFSAVFSVLSFLAPILLPIIVVVFLVKLFRDWLN